VQKVERAKAKRKSRQSGEKGRGIGALAKVLALKKRQANLAEKTDDSFQIGINGLIERQTVIKPRQTAVRSNWKGQISKGFREQKRAEVVRPHRFSVISGSAREIHDENKPRITKVSNFTHVVISAIFILTQNCLTQKKCVIEKCVKG
jgi:hypothetical protein